MLQLQDLLNNSHRIASTSHISDQTHNTRERSKIPFRRIHPVLSEVEEKTAAVFDTRSVPSVRERERREQRQVCEPEGGKRATMPGRNQGTPVAAFFEHSLTL